MREYWIRGQIIQAEAQEITDTSGNTIISCDGVKDDQYKASRESLRVEVWDRDVRYSDRLASTTADSRGFFELRFTDEYFRIEPEERELEPDVFFQLFRKNQFLFKTESELLPEDYFDPIEIGEEFPDKPSGENILPIDFTDAQDDKQGYLADENCYRIGIIYAVVIEVPEAEERPVFELPPLQDKVVDVLPTSEQIANLGGGQTSITTTGRNGSLQQIVNNAFGQVLGQTFRTGNITDFRDSLSQTFAIKENNGQREIIYNPRSYTTQTDLGGAITGAQASLYHRAKAALKEILPLLDGLYELDPSSDQQNREAVRSIIHTEIVELVNEMGVQRGPRVQRVDSLFELLIGTNAESRLPEQIGGQLRDLADIFGLHRSSINTVDEERNYGNFLIIRDYIVSLRQSWQDYLDIQQSGSGAFVGTQLVLLSQALEVMAESVRETYRIMDLVFLGPEERQSVWIDFTLARDPQLQTNNNSNLGRRASRKLLDLRTRIRNFEEDQDRKIAFLLPDGSPIYVDETAQLVPAMDLERLLSWATRFATEEGPTLARSGGKLGIANAIANTATKLMILIQAASYVPVGNTAYNRAGAIRALRDLAFQTYQVKRLAEELIPPLLPREDDDVGDRQLSFGDGDDSINGLGETLEDLRDQITRINNRLTTLGNAKGNKVRPSRNRGR